MPGLLVNVTPSWTSTFGMIYEPKSLRCGRYPVTTWQYGFSGAVSGSAALMAQLSAVVCPSLKPPWIVRPLVGRALIETSRPLKWTDSPPYWFADVMKLFVFPNSGGLTLYRPEMTYPPPLGRRGSRGAVTLNSVKSEGLTARLSVTVKPWNQRHV